MAKRYGGAGYDAQGAPYSNFRVASSTLSTTGLTAADDGLLRRVNNRLYMYNGSSGAFELQATNSDAVGGAGLASLRDFSQTTGSRTRAAINDFSAGVKAEKWADLVAPTQAVPLNGQKFSGAGAASAAGELVEYAQFAAAIANAASGVFYKTPVRAVALTNIALSGLQTLDTNVALAAGDRVLVAAQSSAAANGIYVAAAGAWTRATDADADGEIAPGTTVYVREGATEGDKTWGLTGDAAITIGTTAQQWGRVGGSGTAYTAGNDGIVVSGTQISAQALAGGGLTVAAGGLAIAAGFRVRTLSGSVPSGSTSAVITHNWNTRLVLPVMVRCATAFGSVAVGELIDVDDTATDLNSVTLGFQTAPTAGQYSYFMVGFGA